VTLVSLFVTVLFGLVLLASWIGGEVGTSVGIWVGLFTSFLFVAISLFTILQVMSRVRSG